MTNVPDKTTKTEPKTKTKKPKLKVPGIFEHESKEYYKYCVMGTFVGWCTACYLGDKFKVRDLFLLTFIRIWF